MMTPLTKEFLLRLASLDRLLNNIRDSTHQDMINRLSDSEKQEIISVCSQRDPTKTAIRLPDFRIKSQEILVAEAEKLARLGTSAYEVHRFGIESEEAKIRLAEIHAQRDQRTIEHLHLLQITDREALLRIIRICIQTNGLAFREVETFGIRDPNLLRELFWMAMDSLVELGGFHCSNNHFNDSQLDYVGQVEVLNNMHYAVSRATALSPASKQWIDDNELLYTILKEPHPPLRNWYAELVVKIAASEASREQFALRLLEDQDKFAALRFVALQLPDVQERLQLQQTCPAIRTPNLFPTLESIITGNFEDSVQHWNRINAILIGMISSQRLPRIGFHSTNGDGVDSILASKATDRVFWLAGVQFNVNPILYLRDLYNAADKSLGYVAEEGGTFIVNCDKAFDVHDKPIAARVRLPENERLSVNERRFAALLSREIDDSEETRLTSLFYRKVWNGPFIQDQIPPLSVEQQHTFKKKNFPKRVRGLLAQSDSLYSLSQRIAFFKRHPNRTENFPLVYLLTAQELIMSALFAFGIESSREKLSEYESRGAELMANLEEHLQIDVDQFREKIREVINRG